VDLLQGLRWDRGVYPKGVGRAISHISKSVRCGVDLPSIVGGD